VAIANAAEEEVPAAADEVTAANVDAGLCRCVRLSCW
jgi:hypothetical protein